jgi:hypothetical protein
MPLYRLSGDSISPIERTTFQSRGIRERQDLQAILKKNIQIVSPDTLIVAEEFGDWEDSRRRIDLLGIDRDANLIVIELKRTEDGGHMELQAIRYAAMISSLTFEKLVAIYSRYLEDNSNTYDAHSSLLEFLDWSEPDEELFGREVKIVLASAEFSKELTSSVLWLNDFGLDIRCVRLQPYLNNGETILDIQIVIPMPEASDYQIKLREKRTKERESRASGRDLTKYDVSINGEQFRSLNKRSMMFQIISAIMRSGGSPIQIAQALPWRGNRTFKIFDGELDHDQLHEKFMEDDPGGRVPRAKRFYSGVGEFFHFEGKTYVLSNQWGNNSFKSALTLAEMFPQLKIETNPST